MKIKSIGAIMATVFGCSAAVLATAAHNSPPQNNAVSTTHLILSRASSAIHQAPQQVVPSKVKRSHETDIPTLRGMVVDADMAYICEFKAENGLEVKNIFSDYDMPDGSGGAFYADGKYYVSSLESPYIGTFTTCMTVYDADSWDILEERENLLPSSSAYCATYDPVTNAVYGYFLNDEMESTWQMFGRMNLATGEVFGLNNVDTDEAILAIATGTDGYLYGVNATGMFCRISKRGEISKLGHTDIKPRYVQSAAIDPMTGKFYWAGFTDEGQGGLYVVDPDTYLASLIQEFPRNEEIIGLYVVDNTKESEMPEDVKDITVEFIRDSHKGTVAFTAPDIYCDGNLISGTLTAHVAVDGNHSEKSIAPGESVSLEVEVAYDGLYNVACWVSTAGACGNKSYVQKWIGKDRPGPVQNLKADADVNKVILSWEAPSVGIHGGYVDASDVTYIIDRDGYGRMYIRDYKDTRFEDVFDEDVIADVRYSVRMAYNDYGSPSAYTEWIHIGPDVLTVPVSLSANSDFKKFIVIDANGDANTWESSWSGCAVYNGGSQTADDWMLTPEIQLDGGKVYQLEYDASAKMGLFSPEVIEVKCGQGETPECMTQQLDYQEISTIGIVKFNTYNVSFTVPEDGLYRIGFHALSDKGNQMGLANISIKSLASSAGPAAPTALSVDAAPKAELKATVRCILPLKDFDGNELNAISKVELYNGERLAASTSDAKPGDECVLTDENPAQGTNRYTVVAYGEDGTKGISADVSGWVGIDVPQTPTNLTLVETESGAMMTWELSEVGENGGYVDYQQVIYQILDPYYGTEIAVIKGVKEADINFEKPSNQSQVRFALLPSTMAGSPEDMAVSPTIIVGPGYELPFYERFGASTDYGWIQNGSVSDDIAGWAPEKETVGVDGLAGLSVYYGEIPSDRQALASGKISIPADSDPTLTMLLMARGSREGAGSFRIIVSDAFGTEGKAVVEKSLSNPEAGWENVKVSMKEFAGKDIFIALDAVPSGIGSIFVAVDNLAVRDVKDYDGAVVNITVDTDEVEVSRKFANVHAWIANQGGNNMADGEYSVDFYVGNRMFASVHGEAMEPLFGYSDYSVSYEPSTDDADPSTIYAKLSYVADQYEVNNISKELSIYVVSPDLPGASNLAAEKDENGVLLKWDAADLSGKPIRTVTDDFEIYRTFDNNRAGAWTIIDEDRQKGVKVSYFFPSSSDALGWVVMEPGAIPTMSGSLADRLPAYSGEKYMAAYCAGDNKDWLITPELSGNAQTVSFMARAESVNEGREMFEIYYSVTGTELTDFIRLDDIIYRTEPKGWSEFRFNVPAGAKYFAVRCVSHNRCAMHIDDFTYESAATAVDAQFIGYNIYGNGILLNEKPITQTTYRLLAPDDGCEYFVRAVYDRGLAPASNSIAIEYSGVELVLSDIDPSVDTVYDIRGIRVYNLHDGEIYVTRGKKFIYRR